MLCYDKSVYVMMGQVKFRYVKLFYVKLSSDTSSYAMFQCVKLCKVIRCYVKLRHVNSCYITSSHAGTKPHSHTTVYREWIVLAMRHQRKDHSGRLLGMLRLKLHHTKLLKLSITRVSCFEWTWDSLFFRTKVHRWIKWLEQSVTDS